MVVVICGPSGAGKGTVVAELLRRDATLWLSRSWTTRPRRPGEPADAYVFVDREAFEARIVAGGFLEWAEVFSGHLYGTPLPEPPAGRDVILEIDVQGARLVREREPRALVILLVPPSADAQVDRLRARGDLDDEQLAERVAKAAVEVESARSFADAVVVNDDLSRAVAEVADIVDTRRTSS